VAPLDTPRSAINSHPGGASKVLPICGQFSGVYAVRDFFDLQFVILVGAETLHEAMRFVMRCEFCSPQAQLPFDYILDRVTGHDPVVTDYIMVECAARCPHCRREINEKTLVEVAP